ncbi:hypothetical protein LCGC14_1166040 [marine sediment metagenome]|uniref:Phage tail tape measure protein domain-containing protein n=1 Tax=marine sediment metagenome TaxID=412755 RepID=A0A0F9ME91_9ZZZZ
MAEGTIKVILDPDTRKLDRALKGKRVGVGGGETPTQKKQQKESTILTGLTKRVLATVAGIALVITALDFIIKPLAALLTAILTLLFLPLLPIMVPVFKVLAKLIPQIAKFSQKASNIIQKLVDFFTGTTLGKFLINPFGFLIDFLKKGAGVLLNIGQFLIDNFIVPGFLFLIDVGKRIWTSILRPAWEFLSDIGSRIWNEIIKPGFSFLLNVGQRAWNLMKSGFNFVKDALRRAANAIITAVNRIPFVNIPKLAGGGIVTRPTLAVVGEKGPEAIIPLNQARGFGGNITININNPIVREERDLKKLADQVSRIFAKNKLRGFAPSF